MSLDDKLSALLAGDLPPSEAADLRRRIDADPDVAARWARMLELVADLDDLEVPDVPEDLVQRTLAATADLGEPAADEGPGGPTRYWTVAAVVFALAAGVLLGIGLAPGSPEPVGIDLRGERVEVDGRATLLRDDVRVDVDGRAELSDTPEGVQVRVLQGRATVTPRGGASVELEPSQQWQSAVAPAPPSAPVLEDECDTELAETAATLERVQVELALARGRLYTHEGEPLAWPDELAPELLPGGFEQVVRDAVEAGVPGELLAVDCSEYPCAVLFYELHDGTVDRDWEAVLRPLADELGEPWDVVSAVRDHDKPDGTHTVAVLAVMDPARAEELEDRLMFRARELISTFQPDAMR